MLAPLSEREISEATEINRSAVEELEHLRRSIAMLKSGSLAMTREDAMRLLGGLGEVRGRLERFCERLRAVLADEDAWQMRGSAPS